MRRFDAVRLVVEPDVVTHPVSGERTSGGRLEPVPSHEDPRMHTAVLGPPSDEVKRLADLSSHALDGRVASDVVRQVQPTLDEVADEALTAGMFDYSIGLAFPPTWREMLNFVSLDNDEELEVGMTFHSPIPLRIPNRLGLGFSETWTVTESGCEVLTKRDRSLFVAPD